MNQDWLVSNLSVLPQLLVNSLITGSIYALASSGLALSYGVTKVLNFAHGHLMMLGAYLFLHFYVLLHMPLALALAATLVGAAGLAVLMYLIFIKPFAHINSLLPFITTISLSAILEAVVSLAYGVNVQSLGSGTFSDSLSFGSVYISPLQILVVASSILLLFMTAVLVHRSGFGRQLRAVASNSAAANSLGINHGFFLAASFIFGVVLATIAGILVGFETNLQPTMGNSYTIKAFAAMILGGLGNIWGTIVGAYLLGLIENLAIGLDFAGFSLPAGYKDAFAFAAILLVLLFRPQGLFGVKSRQQ
jgi:branched-chain amino acid transport system permease protein